MVEELMKNRGIKVWWISSESLPDIVIMARVPPDVDMDEKILAE